MTPLVLIISLMLLVPSVHPSQGKDPNAFDNFGDAFGALDKEEKINNAIDEGFVRWEDGCLQVGGEKARDAWLKAQEDLIYCFMQNFDVIEIQSEINVKKRTGDLDLVFKKYCGKPVRDFLPCVESFLEASRNCVRTQDKSGINVTMNMVDSAIEFMCHNSGDRMALFMAEDGIDCLERHRGDIMNCLNETDFFEGTLQRTNWILFDQSHCRTVDKIRTCVESELLKCPDPTPSNIINSMLLAMKNATPCRTMTARASYMAEATSGSLPSALPNLYMMSIVAAVKLMCLSSYS